MALQDITTKILDDAKVRAEEILQSAQKDIAALRSDVESQQKKEETHHDEDVSSLLEVEERATLSRARRDARQVVSDKKRAIINTIKQDITQALIDANDATYTSFLKSIVADLDINTAAVVEVRVPEKRLALTQEVLADLIGKASVVAHAEISAGVIFVGDKVDYDCTLERRMHDLSTDIEAKIVEHIFA